MTRHRRVTADEPLLAEMRRIERHANENMRALGSKEHLWNDS